MTPEAIITRIRQNLAYGLGVAQIRKLFSDLNNGDFFLYFKAAEVLNEAKVHHYSLVR